MIHKGIVAALIAVAILTGCGNKQTSTITDTRGLAMTYITTFKLKPANRVLVEAYAKMSDQADNVAPQRVRDITDAGTIATIVTLANALPDEGQIMKKLSAETPLLRATFFYDADTVYFEYYGTTIKTPATSFYAQHPEEEKKLYDLLSEGVK